MYAFLHRISCKNICENSQKKKIIITYHNHLQQNVPWRKKGSIISHSKHKIGFTLCACILPHIVDFSAHLSRLYTPRRLLDNLFLAWVTKGGTDLHSKRQCISYRPLVSPVKQRRQVLYIGKLLGQLPPFFENKKFLSH